MKHLITQSFRCSHRIRTRKLVPLLQYSNFHSSCARLAIKPILLADVGEGITECEIVQWFVQPGARVAQFDKICEVQSDKAAAEITSRYDGVITKIHYDAEQIAKVGQPLADIDVEEEVVEEAEKSAEEPPPTSTASSTPPKEVEIEKPASSKPHLATLATPAVRHLSKQLGVDLSQVNGTGKDGRVTKEDIQKFSDGSSEVTSETTQLSRQERLSEDKSISLTGVKGQMYKNMSKSLAIPHFLWTGAIDFSSLSLLRSRLATDVGFKISPLPFIVKAVSMALVEYPQLNANLDTTDPSKPVLTQKAAHNFGIAIDSPSGLVVPVLRNVESLSISEISARVKDLATQARAGKLSPGDFSGATFTLSNIGSIGGGAVAPVIPVPQVAILGIGRSRSIALWDDEKGGPKKVEECIFSWSADHRVVDGATIAKAGEKVRILLEQVGSMLIDMK